MPVPLQTSYELPELMQPPNWLPSVPPQLSSQAQHFSLSDPLVMVSWASKPSSRCHLVVCPGEAPVPSPSCSPAITLHPLVTYWPILVFLPFALYLPVPPVLQPPLWPGEWHLSGVSLLFLGLVPLVPCPCCLGPVQQFAGGLWSSAYTSKLIREQSLSAQRIVFPPGANC